MVGINLFGFRKFELLRGGDGGGGGGEGPGGVDGDLGEFGGAGADVSGAGGTAGTGTGGVGPGAADASFGGLQGTDAATGGGGGFSFEAAEADAGGFDAVDVGFGAGDMGMSSGDLAGSDALGGLGEVDVANLGSDVSFGVSPGQAAAQVGTGYGGLLGGLTQDNLDMIDPMGDSFGAAQATEDSLATDATAFDQGMSGLLGGDSVSPVDFTVADAVTTGAGINPAALAAATGIVGAGISDPTETGIQDPSGITVLDAMTPVGVQDPSGITVDTGLTGNLESLSTSPGIETTVETPSFNAAALDAMLDGPVSPEAATVDDSLNAFGGSLTPSDISFNQTAFDQMMGAPVGTGAGVTTPSGTMGLQDEDVDMQVEDLGTGVTSDTLYGTSPSVIDPVTGLPQQVTAMSPAKAAAMTGGVPGTMTGMNLAQDQNSLAAANQAAAMDVLGAQIGAGNLTGNEDIDQVNQELAKQGVQIDSGLPGLLGTGVNAFNQNYQLNKNQDILSQLAQGSNVPDTGILGTGIGAVKGVNTYKPAYNAQGQIVGSVATDAAGNAVGGPAGITTNVVGGINAMPELFSDAAGTQLYTGANQAVGDFQDMIASSQSSEEGPPEDVTSVDANGCVIGAEFFDGQKCSPIQSGTGDATGGGTGGAFTPYNYQPGQGTMLRPDFSDAFTSNVQFNTLNPNASNMNFLKPAVNPYGNFAGGGIVPMMRNNSVR